MLCKPLLKEVDEELSDAERVVVGGTVQQIVPVFVEACSVCAALTRTVNQYCGPALVWDIPRRLVRGPEALLRA